MDETSSVLSPRRPLWIGLGLFTLFLTVCWLMRLGHDLTWDEALSFRLYARHPLTALGLYLEPNNHVFDSFFRSLFSGVLGFSDFRQARLPSVFVLFAYLALLGLLVRRFALHGHLLAPTVLTVGLLSATGTQDQVLNMRGYFPTMALTLGYFCYLTASSRLLEPASKPPPLTRRRRLAYGGLSALLSWTVPTNLLMLPALWLATVLAHGPARSAPKAGGRLRSLLGEWLLLSLYSGGLACVLYAPIFLGFFLGINRVMYLSAGDPGSFTEGFGSTVRLFLRLDAPKGLPLWLFLGLAAILILRGSWRLGTERRARVGFSLFLVLVATVGAFGEFLEPPARIFSPFVVPAWFALALMVGRPFRLGQERFQLWASVAILALGLPVLAAAARPSALQPHRTPSAIADFLEIYGLKAEEKILVCVDPNYELIFHLERRFGTRRVVGGPADLEETLSGEPRTRVEEDRRWKTWLRRRFYPEVEQEAVDLDSVEVLAVVYDDAHYRDRDLWRQPALQRLRARLQHREEFRKGEFRIVIHHSPSTSAAQNPEGP